VQERRARYCRSVLATLLLSQGVPMMNAGDELGRTQGGNNNAYCQDNATSWVDWQLDGAAERQLAFVSRLVAFRRSHPVLRRRRFLRGRPVSPDASSDLTWFDTDGRELAADRWADPQRHAIAMRLDGESVGERAPTGEEIRGATLLILFNAGARAMEFVLPSSVGAWRVGFDTAAPLADTELDSPRYRVDTGAVVALVDTVVSG